MTGGRLRGRRMEGTALELETSGSFLWRQEAGSRVGSNPALARFEEARVSISWLL
jgi:hypothetical protein